MTQIKPNIPHLFEKCIVAKKANELLSFCGGILPVSLKYVNEMDFFKTRNLASIDLIKNIIIPTVGSEGDVIYWEQVIWEIENMGDARYIEYEEPEERLELEDRVDVGNSDDEEFIYDREREKQEQYYETDLKIKAFELAQNMPSIVNSNDIVEISDGYIEAAKKIFEFIRY